MLGAQTVQAEQTLNELDTGIFTGLTVAEIRRCHPEAWRSFQRCSWEGVPRAERIETLLERSERLWKRLGELFGGGLTNLLCVTHSGILQWIIKATAGGHSWMPLVPVENCSISHFSLDNVLDPQNPRYYFEWTRLNFRPAVVEDSSGHMFLQDTNEDDVP